jgi:hypothetical protein
MPAAIVSYFKKLSAVKNTLDACRNGFMGSDSFLMIAIVFVGMVMHPAGPEIY